MAPKTVTEIAMMYGQPPDIAVGGACAWQLPPDASGPPMARSLLARTMTELGLAREQIDDAVLAVSECSTNSLQHAAQIDPQAPVVAPELWVWARISPAPELVVSVFDSDHTHLPHPSRAHLLDERGKGIGILAAVTAQWGSRRTRSRLTITTTPGKAVWFSFPLPRPWPGENLAITPAVAAHKLLSALAARTIQGTSRSDDRGICVVHLDRLNVWVEPKCFTFSDGNGGYTRLPLIDLQEAVEQVLHQLHGDEALSPT